MTHVGRKVSQVSLFLYMILLVLSIFILIYNANTVYLNCFSFVSSITTQQFNKYTTDQ